MQAQKPGPELTQRFETGDGSALTIAFGPGSPLLVIHQIPATPGKLADFRRVHARESSRKDLHGQYAGMVVDAKPDAVPFYSRFGFAPARICFLALGGGRRGRRGWSSRGIGNLCRLPRRFNDEAMNLERTVVQAVTDPLDHDDLDSVADGQ